MFWKKIENFLSIFSFFVVVEFQNGGIVSARIISTLNEARKIERRDPLEVEKIVSAKIQPESKPDFMSLF